MCYFVAILYIFIEKTLPLMERILQKFLSLHVFDYVKAKKAALFMMLVFNSFLLCQIILVLFVTFM